MKIVYFEITFLYLIVRTASFPVEDADDDDESGHLGHIYNSGSPLYFDNSHHNEYNEYPGYDGYASYAPHHDHEHYAYPRYKFEYGVHDPHTGDIKKQYEERDGDVVRGFYSLVEPDGSIRIVEYTADDKHGFQATVKKIGPSHHPHPPTHHSEHNNHNYPYDDHHHPYEDHYQPYPHHEVSNYFPSHYPNPYGSEEDNGYGYNVYEHPNPYGYGDQNNAHYHYGLGGQEYDDNEDYPYHSNTNYPTYVLPQNSYSAIQDLTSYGESHVDIENPDKYYYKRSPVKKFDLKEHSQLHPSVKPFKENSAIKPLKEVKKLEQSETKEIKAEVKISTTPSNELGKSQKKT